MRSRLYQILALVTAGVGLLIFVVLYFQHIDGQFDEALRSPKTLVILVIPFLPAIVLSILAERARSQFVNALQQIEPGKAGAATVAPATAKKK